MANISDLRVKILAGVGDTLTMSGFVDGGANTFWRETTHVLQGVSVAFLDRNHAARFKSNTASFSLELGVFFKFISCIDGRSATLDEPPPYYECHIRRKLYRDIIQLAPPSGYGRFHHDIWWLDSAGHNLDRLVQSARRVLNRTAEAWFGRFSDLFYVHRYLATRNVYLPGSPFNIGKKGCPFRQELIRQISNRIETKAISPGEWR